MTDQSQCAVKRCPSCGDASSRLVHAVDQAPVHCASVFSQRAAAVDSGRGDIRLMCCERCGFLFNSRFEPRLVCYGSEYEESQGYSPTFGAFAKSIVQNLVETHALHGKAVLEIGCGKGDFLVAMCEYGDCRGIGIDPAVRPERLSLSEGLQIDWIQDVYDRRHRDIAADCVVCRHTLEHIDTTLSFMQELRASLEGRRDTVVFFEVPDARRILNEGAFWDIYYEHCSYFTCGSLARLFRFAGFDVVSVDRVYNDQYLHITATPADDACDGASGCEEDADDILELARTFRVRVDQCRAYWMTLLNDGRTGDTVLWGSGSKAVSFLATPGIKEECSRVVDINPYRQGKFMPGSGLEIVSPRSLRDSPPDTVIVMNPVYTDEITRNLASMGLFPEVVVVGRDGVAAPH